MKEIKVGPNTGENDLSYRIKQMIEFLKKGHKVRITMQFRGREMTFVSNGEALLLRMIVAVEESGLPEALPKLEGKKMSVIIRPKTNK
jgi:translation initiation factor IF-3